MLMAELLQPGAFATGTCASRPSSVYASRDVNVLRTFGSSRCFPKKALVGALSTPGLTPPSAPPTSSDPILVRCAGAVSALAGFGLRWRM